MESAANVERHLQINKTARYYLRGNSATPRELWIVCHGYGQLAGRFLRHFAPIDDGTRLFVAPEALNRFYLGNTPGMHGTDAKVGATWMTREDRLVEIADYVAYLDRVLGDVETSLSAKPVRVVALGFSQGVAVLARWIGLGAESARVSEAVFWGGILPPEAEDFTAKLRACPLTFVVGLRDADIHRALTNEQEQRMRAMELSFAIETFDGGHEMDGDTLRRVAPQ